MEVYDQKIKDLEKLKKSKSDMALSIFITSMLVLVVVCAIVVGVLSSQDINVMRENPMRDPAIGAILVITITTAITVLIGMSKKEKKKQEKIDQMVEERRQFVQKSYCAELFVLPPAYRYALACEYILSCFQNMRADTMKEAVNLYVEQLDRWKQESMLQNLQNQMNQMNQIQRQQAASDAFFETAVFIGLMRR